MDEREPPALLELGHRLGRLQSLAAPPRLREEALARALAAPIPRRARVVPLHTVSGEWGVLLGRLAASAVVAFGAAYGTVAASAASLPNSPLYPVKLLVEDIRVAVAPTDQRPQVYVEIAERRVEETRTLVENGRIPEAERTIEDASRRIAAARAAVEQTPRTEHQLREAITVTSQRVQAAADDLTHRTGSTSSRVTDAAGPVSQVVVPVVGEAERAIPGVQDPLGETLSGAPINPVVPAPSGGADQPLAGSVSAPGAQDSGLARPGAGFTVVEPGRSSPGEPAGSSGRVAAPVGGFNPLQAGSPAGSPTATPTATAAPAASSTPVAAAPVGPVIVIPGR